MRKSKIIASMVVIGLVSVAAIYFNGTMINSNDTSTFSQNNNLGGNLQLNSTHGIDTEIDTSIDTVDDSYGDYGENEQEEIPEPDFDAMEDERITVDDLETSIDTGLEVLPTEFGYRLQAGDDAIDWYLQDTDGTPLKQAIPFDKNRLNNMGNIVADKIGRRFPGGSEYINYPAGEENGETIYKRIKREDLIESLTLLESMWEKHGGDDYGTLFDKVGEPTKIFSPDIEFERDDVNHIQYGDLQPYEEEELSSRLERIQDFFVNAARANDSYAIPFEIFDRTWGNTNLFGLRGKIIGTIGLWGNVEDGGSYSLSTTVDLSAYIFGNRKNFMFGNGSTKTDCEIPSDYSRLTNRYNVTKWGNPIHSSLPYFGSSEGTCRASGWGGTGMSVDSFNVNFDGFDACVQYTVFAGLKVRGCAGVKGNSSFDFSATGLGAINRAYISTKQSLPYYGRASLALSPAGFDLAELSMNVSGKLLDMEHTFDSTIFSHLGADSSSQKADLIWKQYVLGGRVYLKIRWWSIIQWRYKSWTKEIKSNGWVRQEGPRTTDLLQGLR